MVFDNIFINIINYIEPSAEDYSIIKQNINAKGQIKIQIFGLPPDNIYRWIRIIDLENDFRYLWKLEERCLFKIDKV
tara:strand:- start:76 stop:306 length:231 start_codon:yes stop_codon:yes gene_type:complete